MKINYLKKFILESTLANEILSVTKIQTLWRGYGEILKVKLKGENIYTVIVKNIVFPDSKNLSKNDYFSHQRKYKSYEVEINWYKYYQDHYYPDFKYPKCIGIQKNEKYFLLILEDMDNLGYTKRLNILNNEQVLVCLKWLANFHGYFIDIQSKYLWDIGTYWHLDTRPEEFNRMKPTKLKENAKDIDTILNSCKYKTLVHGDAKTENFCFSDDITSVCAVDFQYVGNGCGMKDVIYLFESALTTKQLNDLETSLIDYYFKELKLACDKFNKKIDFFELENEWRKLYPLCKSDFYRFLEGWNE